MAGRAERDTDPLPSSAATEVVVAAQGRSGVPTGLSTPDAIARATERTGVRTVAPQAPKPVGLDTTGLERPTEAQGGSRASAGYGWRETCRWFVEVICLASRPIRSFLKLAFTSVD